MRLIRTTMCAALLSVIAACTATDGIEKRNAGTNPPAQIAEATSPEGSPFYTSEEGDISSRAVGLNKPCIDINCQRQREVKLLNSKALPVPVKPQVPPPPTNGGQCVIDIAGEENDQTMNASTTTTHKITYRHTEIQQWVVSGPARQVPGVVGKVYTMAWSTTGNGTKDDVLTSTMAGGQSHQERHLTVWYLTGTAPTQLSVWLRPSDNRWVINQANLPTGAPTGWVTDAQQHTSDGVIQASYRGPVTGPWREFTDSFYNWTVPGNMTQITNSPQGTINVRPSLGYAQINPAPGHGGLTGGVTCTWNFNLLLP